MIYDTDTYLEPFQKAIKGRHERLLIRKGEIAGFGKRITDAINNHLFYGVHREGDKMITIFNRKSWRRFDKILRIQNIC